ncbi:MAG: hypothetical protein GQF41_3682 [Candidatus Rifleibacterium amylolyticum]|nr:MAG: hypothetical protein GQF41_3682 [Candidatus Rifleibacterium amylolyticum]
MNKSVCIIIPCYNEQENIAGVIAEVVALPGEREILVINDGSTDATSMRARETGKAVVIDMPANLGVGGAVQTGLKYAARNNYQYAVKLDGDGQHNPASIDSLLQPLHENNADIVIGSRFITENEGFKSTFWRRAGISVFEFIVRWLTGRRITDATSGLRAYNRSAIEFMEKYYPSFDYPEPEEIILACKNQLRLQEIPVVMRERRSGMSTISSAMSIYFMLKVTLSMLFISLRSPEKKEG